LAEGGGDRDAEEADDAEEEEEPLLPLLLLLLLELLLPLLASLSFPLLSSSYSSFLPLALDRAGGGLPPSWPSSDICKVVVWGDM